MVEGLNKDNFLPEYIVIIPDRDIILELNYFKPGMVFVLDQLIKWLTQKPEWTN